MSIFYISTKMNNLIKRTTSVVMYTDTKTMPVRPRTTSPRPSSPLSKFVTTKPDGEWVRENDKWCRGYKLGGWIRQTNGEWQWRQGEGKWICQANGEWQWEKQAI